MFANQKHRMIGRAGVFFALFFICAAIKLRAADYRAIEAAVRQEDLAAITRMIQDDGGVNSESAALFMVAAARSANNRVLNQLLDMGINIDITPSRGSVAGENALMHAACTGHDETVDFLLKRGAKAGFVGYCADLGCRGHTALVGAVNFRSVEISRKLLAAGANPNAVDGLAIKIADQNGEVEIYQLLLSYGGKEPNTQSNLVPLSLRQGQIAGSLPYQLLRLSDAETTNMVPAASPDGRRWRIAVLADDANTTAGDVLIAKLTMQHSLEVLERQELNRVLAEQKLSRQFAVAEANAGIMAGLLRADAILFLRKREVAGLSLLETRLVLSHPGVVLDTVYQPAPLKDVHAWANAVCGRETELIYRAATKSAVALSLLGFHSTLPSEKARSLARTLEVLFRDQLVHDRRFVVLERTEMGALAFEAGDTNNFQGGAWVLDPLVNLSVDKSGSFDLALRIQPIKPGGEFLVKVDGKITAPAEAVAALKKAMEARLGLEVSAPQSAGSAEAEHYFREANWAFQVGEPEAAQMQADAAWNLGLQTLEIARLRACSAIQSVYRQCNQNGGDKESASAKGLDSAIHATTIWQDTLLSDMLQANSQTLRAWLESLPELENAVKLAIASVTTSRDKIRETERIETLRQAYWSTLGDALQYSKDQPAESGLVNMVSEVQANDARQMLQSPQELLPVLREIFSRHYPTNDVFTRSKIRAQFSWDRTKITNGSVTRADTLPRELAAKKQFIGELRSSSSVEDQFRAVLLECDRDATYLSPPEAISLMEHFWAMRNLMASDGVFFKAYYDRFDFLVENEPMGENGYTPRIYTLKLPTDDNVETAPVQITQFEFRRRLYLYLLDHAKLPQPQFQLLMDRGAHFFSQDQIAEVQQAFQNYVSRTKASGTAFAPRNQMASMGWTTTRTITTSPLPVQRLWHPFNLGLNLNPDFRVQASGICWAEDKIWLCGYVESPNSSPSEPRHYIFAVDPLRLRTGAYIVPTNVPSGAPNNEALFIVSSNSILFGTKDYFAMYDRRSKDWEIFGDIKPDEMVLDSQPERELAYMIIENRTAVISFDLKSRTSHLLASTRRHPAEGPLDDPNWMIKSIWKNDAGKIMVLTRSTNPALGLRPPDKFFELSLNDNQWQPVPKPPQTKSKFANQPVTQLAQNVTFDRQVRVGGISSANMRIFRLPPQYPVRDILLDFDFSLAEKLPWNRFGRQNLDFMPYTPLFACPVGYFICAQPGPGFWFIPKPEFDEYLKNVGD